LAAERCEARSAPAERLNLALADTRGGRDVAPDEREFVDYKTSMITDYDPLRGLLFY